MKKGFVLFLFFSLCSIGSFLCGAELVRDLSQYSRKPDDKIALVLSGGGAKGIAHIPVFEMLEKYNIVPDYIIGTSMGSLMGGLYASGLSASELADLVINENFVSLFSTYPPPPMSPLDSIDPSRSELVSFSFDEHGLADRSGVIDDFRITSILNRYVYPLGNKSDFDDLPIKYRAVTYNFTRKEREVISKGNIVEAMRASMGIPIVFQIYRIGECGYLDGGLADNIPVSVAMDLGANIIITSDVADKDNKGGDSFISVGVRLISQVNQTRFNSLDPDKNSTIYIAHDNSGFNMLGFYKATEILERSRKTLEAFDSDFAKLRGEGEFHPFDRLSSKGVVARICFSDVSNISRDDSSEYLDDSRYELEEYLYKRFSRYSGRRIDSGFFDELESELSDVRMRLDLDTIGYVLEEVGDDAYDVRIRFSEKKPAKLRVSISQALGATAFGMKGYPAAYELDPTLKIGIDFYSKNMKHLVNSFSLALKRDVSVSLGYELTNRNKFSPYYFQYRIDFDVGNIFNCGSMAKNFFENYDHAIGLEADFFFDEKDFDISIGLRNSTYILNKAMRDFDIRKDSDVLFARFRGIFFDSRIPRIIKNKISTVFFEAALGADFSLSGSRSAIPVYSLDFKLIHHQNVCRNILIGFDASFYANRFSPSIKSSYAKYSYFNDFFIPSRLISEYYGFSLSASYVIEQVFLADMVLTLNLAWQQSDDASDEFEYGVIYENKAEVLGGLFSSLSRKSLTLDFQVGLDTTIVSVAIGGGVDFLSGEWRLYVRL